MLWRGLKAGERTTLQIPSLAICQKQTNVYPKDLQPARVKGKQRIESGHGGWAELLDGALLEESDWRSIAKPVN